MKRKLLSIILLVVFCLSGSVCFVHAEETPAETATRYITGIAEILEDNFKYGIDKETLYEAAIAYLIEQYPELAEEVIRAMTDELDEYSVYFDEDELSSFTTDVNQVYIGIGVTAQKSDAGLTVTEVNKNGGAYESGVLAGDEIISVNGQSIAGLSIDEGIKLIKGEEGTTVTLGILRKGVTLTLDVVRKKVIIQSVSHEIMDKVGYIKIDSFAEATPDEVKDALYDIEENHRLNKIVIDVRNNPGGELGSVIKVLGQFVPGGKTLVKFEYKNEKFNYDIKSKATFTKAPTREIVILANKNSASAAELFTGVMQYYKLATVVGETTFGKGSMQEMVGLIDHPNLNLGDIKLTTAEFTKPDGGKINGVGIDPDIAVKIKYQDFDESTLTPMTISARYTVGDEHSDVLAIEERLSLLGYNVGQVDGVFDNLTKLATINFQANSWLYPYGVMDYTTQSVLNDAIKQYEAPIDTQLEKALEILNK